MRSLDLLPDLVQLPADQQQARRSTQEMIQDLVANDKALVASEFAASLSLGLWGIWDKINVPDSLEDAYAAQYPNLAADRSLLEHWEAVQAAGSDSAAGFISGLKGKLAELNAAEMLEQQGFTDVSIAASPIQPGWDISAVNEAGETVLFQVKTGSEAYASSVMAGMQGESSPEFLVGSELHDAISESSPELARRLTEIGPDFELVEGIEGGLTTLSDNLGIDIPDGWLEFLPGAAALLAAVSLISGALETERQFRDVDRTHKNKLQVVKALTVMSRFGISTVFATVGGTLGTAAGSAAPGVGNAVGGIAGSGAGATAGWWVNRRLKPHMLSLALDITGLSHGDLFYFKNKVRIDELGLRLRRAAADLNGAAQPGTR